MGGKDQIAGASRKDRLVGVVLANFPESHGLLSHGEQYPSTIGKP
jgi:hypothetical protein